MGLVTDHSLPYHRQQRFGRLLQKLKAADTVGDSGGSTAPATKPKNVNKKNGSSVQKGGKGRKLVEKEEDEEPEDLESPDKKRATVKNGVKREKTNGLCSH